MNLFVLEWFYLCLEMNLFVFGMVLFVFENDFICF